MMKGISMSTECGWSKSGSDGTGRSSGTWFQLSGMERDSSLARKTLTFLVQYELTGGFRCDGEGRFLRISIRGSGLMTKTKTGEPSLFRFLPSNSTKLSVLNSSIIPNALSSFEVVTEAAEAVAAVEGIDS